MEDRTEDLLGFLLQVSSVEPTHISSLKVHPPPPPSREHRCHPPPPSPPPPPPMEKRDEQQLAGSSSSVMCQLVSPEGDHLGAALYLPQNVGPPQLQEIVNHLLHNEDKLPYAFYIGDEELSVQLGAYMQQKNANVEVTLRIVYQPQAVFRIRPVNRCSATIAGHTEAVLSVSFSPDGRCLASGSGDTTVRFWDLNTQTPLFTCKGHKNWVLCIAWSPDGNHLVSGSKSGELILWDPKTGKQLGTPLTGHRKWITSVSWEPVHLQAPCRRFVSASKDGDARIWDITTRKCVIALTGHTNSVTCVKWGGDGLIYTGSEDCSIKVWETSQGKLVKTLQGHGHWVNSLALSTEYVLRTGAYDHTGKTYSTADEMKEAALARYKKMRGNAPERLVSGSDDFTMFLWEPTISKQPKARMTGHQKLVNHVYFSPDGQWLASASFDKSVKLWNGITGKFVAAFRGHVADVYQISWSADSRLLLSGSKDSTLKVASGGKDRVLKLWMN
uniref:NLE domain-containing protein n=2 Tax=Leersia perrieri TaxID=77586 RepID=A0A0D9XTS9_9ORYZ